MLGERSALAAILSTSSRMLSREFKMQQGVRCAWAWNSYNRFRIVFRLPYRCKQERSVGKFICVARFTLCPVVALVEIKKRRWKFANVLRGEIDYLLRPC